MNFKLKSLIIIGLLLIIGIGAVSAHEIDSANYTSSDNVLISSNENLNHEMDDGTLKDSSLISNDNLNQEMDDGALKDSSLISEDCLNQENDVGIPEDISSVSEDVSVEETIDEQYCEILQDEESDIIEVSNWDELQYYCALKDKDYTLKLKDNTNFYPTKTTDSNYQIKVYNNVKIIGGNGSYFGDKSSSPLTIGYTAIVVPDGYKSSICFENVTFKWINSGFNPDGLFIQMGGKYNNVFRNCNFTKINVDFGHATIVYLSRGNATMENCSFINCTTAYGCVSVYGSSPSMIVRDCYFEGNYATVACGCINNCGKLTVINTTFFKNKSYWWAGAIHTHGGGNTTIYDSNFTDNVAGWNGGALYTYANLQIYNSVFSGNNCTTNNGGGAIGACAYQSNPHIYIEKCLFEYNENLCWSLDSQSTTGTGRGGAISFMDEGSLEVHDTTFITNAAAHGTAICALAMSEYGSPSVIITNNSFINHTRVDDTLMVRVSGSTAVIENNYFYGNSIPLTGLTLTKIEEGKDQARLEVSCGIRNPSYYDSDILNKTQYEVYIDNEYVKTVNSTVFTIDFDELDKCDVYVIPTFSNQKSNSVHLESTREYIFVSKDSGNDDNEGTSRNSPVSSIRRALELAGNCQSIILMDGEYSESNLEINYDLLIKGESNASLTNSTSFIVNAENFTLKNLKIQNIIGETFIKHIRGNLIADKCVFDNNGVSRLFDSDNLNVSRSIFTNNKLIVNNNGFATIKNSIILNNTQIIANNLASIDLGCNWWGNALDNVSKPVDLNIDNWLLLNATSSKGALENSQTSIVQFGILLYENGLASKYDGLIGFNLSLSASNGSVSKDSIAYDGTVIFNQTGYADSRLIACYNDIEFGLDFEFLKSSPNLLVRFSDVMYNEDLIIRINAPNDVTGNISVRVGSETTVKPLSNGIAFTFKYFPAGEYDVFVDYDGDFKYMPQNFSSSVTVRKFNSTTSIGIGEVNVGQDLTISVSTSRGTTGNVNLTINDMSTILTLENIQASYVYRNIPRGDYLITANYLGDDRNLPSNDTYFLEVDNLEPVFSANVSDSNYGEYAVIDVLFVDENSRGWVSASIDGITNSSQVLGGRARICLKGADAGVDRELEIFYSGDNTYHNRTITANMTVGKSNFTFPMTSEDIFVGHDAVISIVVPMKTTGNFTINGTVLSIPMSGELSYVIPDLDVGEYTITAVYEGNNYFTVSNSTTFNVFEYPSPQWTNDGVDTENTQKTDYVSSSTGHVAWADQINSTVIANIVLDSEGNLYLASTGGIYSYDPDGNLRWIYQSDARLGNFSGLAIGRDIIISPRAGDTIYLIRNVMDLVNQTTGEKYGTSNIFQASSTFVPVIDSNAFIYTASEYQFEGDGYNLVITPFRIWENGGNPILLSLGKIKPIAAPTVNEDMLVVLGNRSLMIFDAHTRLVNAIKNGNFRNVRPVIGDGNIVYSILGDSIIAFTIDGSQYGSKMPISGGAGNHLLIDNDLGVLYATNADGNLYAYDLFTYEETLITDLNITSGILIDGNHNLYFASGCEFYGMASNGSILWKADLGSRINGTPIMNRDGVIYVTSEDNCLFALSGADALDPVLTASVLDIVEGENAVISISIDNQTTGIVSFVLDGISYSFDASKGTMVFAVPNLRAGVYKFDVAYPGDLRFNGASKAVSFTVKAIASLDTQVSGNGLTLSLPRDATGSLSVNVNGQTYVKDLVGGKASFTLPYGTYDAIVSYSGDGKYAGFTKTVQVSVQRLAQASKVTKKATKIIAKKKTFKRKVKVKKYTVTLKSGKALIKKVKLSLKIAKKTYKATTNKKGKATFKIRKLSKKGKYTAIVKFAGNKNYKASSKKVKIVIK